MHLSWGILVLDDSDPALGWIYKEGSFFLPSRGEHRRGACIHGHLWWQARELQGKESGGSKDTVCKDTSKYEETGYLEQGAAPSVEKETASL